MTALGGGRSTAIGSMPGTDARVAAEVVIGELDIPTLPELPARGLGADMIGRAAAILVDMPVDVAASGYRLAARPTMLMRRAVDLLRQDLDAVEEFWERSGRDGAESDLTISCVGPYTFAASAELPSGHKIIADRGATADVVDSLTEGLSSLVAEVARRLGVRVNLQLDEPLIGRVIDGHITPLTRLNVIEAVPAAVAGERLTAVFTGVGVPGILHDCGTLRADLVAAMPPMTSGQVAWSVDLGQVRGGADLDAIGSLLDGGGELVAGAVESVRTQPAPHLDDVLARLISLVDRIGLPRSVLAEQVLVSPACGLAGATDDWSREALSLCSRAAAALADDPEAIG
ncbi:methionine synthase [Gordonia jinhuaensis]|uniref:Methionine synthase n=1 Tax=Gordonia jinhuaensis TaxID=1517702 RepID=A0A916SY72_9ACTN|nr:vitamin-B12 independent methionine synthase [Gordonia jinhuaensis]GGB23046.1 methionine synthase [Gordonia jinhuaensis]